MTAVAVVPSFFALACTDCQRSVATRIDRSGVIELRTDSLNPNTSQETLRWVHQCQPTKGLQICGKAHIAKTLYPVRVLACHAL